MKKTNNGWGINLIKVNCPNCDIAQPVMRIPKDIKELLWGGWTCRKCECKMDKYGKIISK
jgi:hypothetical protein